MSPPHPGHAKANSSPTRAMSFAHAIREVSCEGSLSHESQPWQVASPSAACPPTACPPVAASRGLPTFPFVMRRDGGPELVIRGEHPVIAMLVLPRRRHEIGQPVQEVTRREFDDAAGARPRGLSPAPRADPGSHEGSHPELRPDHEVDGGGGASRALPPPDGQTGPCAAVVQQALAEGRRAQGRRQAPPGVIAEPAP